MSTPDLSSFYVTGGTLRADAPSYVARQADTELLDSLLRGEFCYVLTSRQMGKSSLMVRVAQKLRAAGVTVAILDLTSIGHNLSAEQWYNGLLTRLGDQTGLDETLDKFWWSHPSLGPCQRFFTALERVVLPELQRRANRLNAEIPVSSSGEAHLEKSAVPNPQSAINQSLLTPAAASSLVIFVDELDTVRSLSFSTDEFFAAIRECHTRRAQSPEFNRLIFALLGVVTPSDLIRDTRLTPFNIARRIELRDFQEHEALPLADALGRPASVAKAMLHRVLFWTSGHPYLTQRLCQALASNPSVSGSRGVDKLCREIFFSHRARERDDNLLFVRERLLRSEADLISLLRLYRRVHRSTQIAGFLGFAFALRRIEPVADEETNPLVSILRLSGVAKTHKGVLRVRNRIYYQVFDPAWIEANMPVAELWRRWLVVWGMIKRAGRLIATAFLVFFLLAVAGVVWVRPWERVRWEPPRNARRVPRAKPQVPPRDPRATSAMIDLSDHYNAALNRTWHPELPSNHLGALPPGLHTFTGVAFDVRGVVQLSGRRLWRQGFPPRINGMVVGQKCLRLYFLHATGWSVSDGTQIGNYVIRYADGDRRFVPILYGQDVSDWLVPPNLRSDREPETIAWKESATGSSNSLRHRLFVTRWENPEPDVEVVSLDYVSMITDAAPFLIAITAESK